MRGSQCPDRGLRVRPGVERPLEGSWSDGAIIPGPARCLLDGFDPAGRLLLFSWRNRARGLAVSSLATGVGTRSACGLIRFRVLSGLLSEGSVMVRLARPASLIRAATQHAERVYAVAQGAAPAPDTEELSSSWQRSTNSVDPVDSRAPRILTVGELKDSREPLGNLISTAQEELDRLYKVVREAGYTILFCDSAGVAIEHRGEGMEASEFEYWGTWLGGVWAEEIEGANGIGTCRGAARNGPPNPAFPVAAYEFELLRRADLRRRRSLAGGAGRIRHRSATLGKRACPDRRSHGECGARHRRAVLSRAFPSLLGHCDRVAGGGCVRHVAGGGWRSAHGRRQPRRAQISPARRSRSSSRCQSVDDLRAR